MPPRVQLVLMAIGSLALAGAALVLLEGSPGDRVTASGFDGSLRPAGIPVREFVLRDQTGRHVRLGGADGRVTIVTFMYATCRDTCPIVAQQIALGLDRLGHDLPVRAVSVDPARDTPALARSFLERRQLQHRMSFLLGARHELAPIWDLYGIQPEERGLEHSSYVILLDRRGRQRVSFPGDRLTPEELVHDIRRLEAEPA